MSVPQMWECVEGGEEVKRYYWMKLKEDFFESDTINWLEEQENGTTYVMFYLKLCLKALKTDGLLYRQVGNVKMAYDSKKISEITRTEHDTVLVAMDMLIKLGLIAIEDDGTIVITEFAGMVGSESDSAERVRRYRKQNVNKLGTECKQAGTKMLPEKPAKTEKKTTIIIDYNYIFEQYNLICQGMTAVQKQSDSRKKAIKTRLTSGYTVQDIVDVFQKASQSSFLKGNNIRGWRADFDWLLKPDNMIKVMEGKYDDFSGRNQNIKYDDEYYRQLEADGKPVF